MTYKNTPQKRDVPKSMWWLLPDSNWGHKALQASALPTELKSRTGNTCLFYLNRGSFSSGITKT